jgi:RNA polymerase sigma-70 factor, ECF subfamily
MLWSSRPNIESKILSSILVHSTVLSNVDRELLQRCLTRAPGAWEDFVHRYLGLILQVVKHTAERRGVRLDEARRDEVVSDVFYGLLQNDLATLRRFRGHSSLATYLVVVSRRIAMKRVWESINVGKREVPLETRLVNTPEVAVLREAELSEDRATVEAALEKLSQQEAAAIRMFHLEGRTYQEIGESLGLAENSIGPYLSRARAKMRGQVAS